MVMTIARLLNLSVAVDKVEAGILCGIHLLLLIILRRLHMLVSPLRLGHGDVVPLVIDLTREAVAARTLAAPADEEDTARRHGAHDDEKADDGNGNDQREVHGARGNRGRTGGGLAGRKQNLGKDTGWSNLECMLRDRGEVAVIADCFEDCFEVN